MSGLKPPGPLSLNGNVAKNWKDWIRAFELYETATELTSKPESIRCATFLHVAGTAAQQIFETFRFATGETDKILPLKSRFRQYCEPKKNVTVTRYIFNTRNQHTGETFSNYLTELRALAKDCDFGELEESLLKDRIVCGISNQALREKLLQCDGLTLPKCVDLCTITEASAEQMRKIAPKTSATDEPIDAIRREGNAQPQRGRGREAYGGPPRYQRQPRDDAPICPWCTYVHKTAICPAKDMQCHSCGEYGHFSASRRCSRTRETDDRPRARQRDRQHTQSRAIHGNRHVRDIEATMSSAEMPSQRPMYDDGDSFFIDALFDVDGLDPAKEWGQTCSINNVNIDFKLDSGAQVDILPEYIFKKTGLPLDKSCVTLRSYSGHVIKPVGQTNGSVKMGILNTVESYLSLNTGKEGGGGHYATWQSAIHGFANAKELVNLRKSVKNKPLPKYTPRLQKRGQVFWSEDVNKWTLPFPGADASVVRRTQRFLYENGGERPVQFGAYFTLSSMLYLVMTIVVGTIFGFLARYKFGRNLLEKHPKLFSLGTFSHEGPTRKQIEGSSFSITFQGAGFTDEEAEKTGKHNTKIVTQVKGPEAGYIATPIVMIHAALVILDEADKLPKGGGVFTPGAAFNKTSLIERLNKHGVEFSVISAQTPI